MWPDVEVPRPLSYFNRPVPVPALDPDAGTLVCVSFNPVWLPYILGALKSLTLQATWDTTDKAVLDLAQFRAMDLLAIFAAATECPPVLRFRQNDICTLQVSEDDGVSWTTIFDDTACVLNGVNDRVGQMIDNGTLAGGLQQPANGPTNPSQCYDYDITLRGNSQWIAPVPIAAGDIVTITRVSGGWWDGNVTSSLWRCPDGETYFLGSCVAGTEITDAGDPAPTLSHMRLVGHYNAVYFDAYNTATVIPAGVAETDLYLQANDASLADNQGAIGLHVQVCKGGYHHVFDFLTSNGGAVSDPWGTWVAGQGWTFQNNGIGYFSLRAAKDASAPTNVRRAIIRYSIDNVNGDDNGMLRGFVGLHTARGATIFTLSGGHTPGQSVVDQVLDSSGAWDGVSSLYFGTDANVSGVVKSIEIFGLGSDPW